MLFICIFQAGGINEGVSRTDEAEEESEAGADAEGGSEGCPECVYLQLHRGQKLLQKEGAAHTEA